jgi:dUTP pyrophosphatase
MTNEIILGIMRCREGVILPEISEGNAGIDLRVLTENGEPVVIQPNETHKFFTGIKMDIPEYHYVEVVVRSSTGIKKNLRLMNSVAVLDSSWKGETIVALHNFGHTPVTAENNERVCQMILHEVKRTKIVEVDNVGESDRGEKGIGSSGRF